MKFVSAECNYSPEMEGMVEKSQGLPLCPLIGFVFTHKRFYLLGQQSTDRRGASGG
jgi:hypothetical protein